MAMAEKVKAALLTPNGYYALWRVLAETNPQEFAHRFRRQIESSEQKARELGLRVTTAAEYRNAYRVGIEELNALGLIQSERNGEGEYTPTYVRTDLLDFSDSALILSEGN